MKNIDEITEEERARRLTAMLARLRAARGCILITYDTEENGVHGVHMNIHNVNSEELALASLRLARAATDDSVWSDA
jgi:hypothetical protein